MVAPLRIAERRDLEQGQASSWVLILAAAVDLAQRVSRAFHAEAWQHIDVGEAYFFPAIGFARKP
jgi:hypothetical protein